MAAIGHQAHALDNSTRWLGGGAVALLHLLLLLAFLAADRLTQHNIAEPPPLTVYHVPETTRPIVAAPSVGAPSRLMTLPSVRLPDPAGPMILVTPDQPAPFVPRVLDLSIHPGTKKTLDDLAPPSREQALKQFFLDSVAEGRQARELSAGQDCVPSFARDRDAASLPTSPVKDLIPIEDKCSPRESAKSLQRRNDRFSPK